MNTRYKANMALFISVCGLALSFLYANNNFFCGLLYHGFLAAVIGGLADWFAVTAIFRKPFGINWRTDILRRNRPRIMRELTKFIGCDILNPANIMAVWRKENLAALFIRYLFEQGGKEKIINTADKIINRLTGDIDTTKISVEAAPLIKDFIKDLHLEHNVTELVCKLSDSANIDWLLLNCSKLGHELLISSEMQQLLIDNIAAWKTEYIKKSGRRELLFQVINLTDAKLLDILNNKIDRWLTELNDEDSAAGQKLRGYFEQGLLQLTSDKEWEKNLKDKIDRQIDTLTIDVSIDKWLQDCLDRKKETPAWQTALLAVLASKIDEFAVNANWQNDFDSWLKSWLEELLTVNQQWLIEMITNRLSDFSDEEIITLIEDKVSADLQIIRINGALIGSFAGMILYVLTFIVTEVSGL